MPELFEVRSGSFNFCRQDRLSPRGKGRWERVRAPTSSGPLPINRGSRLRSSCFPLDFEANANNSVHDLRIAGPTVKVVDTEGYTHWFTCFKLRELAISARANPMNAL